MIAIIRIVLGVLAMLAKFRWALPVLGPIGIALAFVPRLPMLIAKTIGTIALSVFDGLFGAGGVFSRVHNVMAVVAIIMVASGVGIHAGIWATKEVAQVALQDMRQWRGAHEELMRQAAANDLTNKEAFDVAVAERTRAVLAQRGVTTGPAKSVKTETVAPRDVEI